MTRGRQYSNLAARMGRWSAAHWKTATFGWLALVDSALADVVARVSKVAVVQNVHKGPVSKDGHTALVKFDIRGDKNKAGDKVGSVLDRVDEAQSAHPGFFIGEFGDASAQKAVDQAAANDLKSAGMLSIPITLIILVVAFGALVAAGIPP